jgi:hypothetical protein
VRRSRSRFRLCRRSSRSLRRRCGFRQRLLAHCSGCRCGGRCSLSCVSARQVLYCSAFAAASVRRRQQRQRIAFNSRQCVQGRPGRIDAAVRRIATSEERASVRLHDLLLRSLSRCSAIRLRGSTACACAALLLALALRLRRRRLCRFLCLLARKQLRLGSIRSLLQKPQHLRARLLYQRVVSVRAQRGLH